MIALEAAKAAALAIPAKDAAAILVRGSDRISWLNGLVTCEVRPDSALPRQATYGLIVTKKGRITADIIIVPSDDRLTIIVPRSVRDEVISIFDHHLVMEDVELATDEPHIYFVHGPRAGEVRVPDAICSPIDLTGLGGAIVIASRAIDEELAASVQSIGGAMGDEEAWEALRVERGIPRFGKDFDQTTYPQEASLEKRAVSFEKGCYLGQEVVCMLELRGHVKRKIVPVVLSQSVPAGTAIADEKGAEIGRVTSVALVPSKVLGLAMLKLAHAVPGATVRAGEATATVVP